MDHETVDVLIGVFEYYRVHAGEDEVTEVDGLILRQLEYIHDYVKSHDPVQRAIGKSINLEWDHYVRCVELLSACAGEYEEAVAKSPGVLNAVQMEEFMRITAGKSTVLELMKGLRVDVEGV